MTSMTSWNRRRSSPSHFKSRIWNHLTSRKVFSQGFTTKTRPLGASIEIHKRFQMKQMDWWMVYANGFAVFWIVFSHQKMDIYRCVEASKFMATCYSSLPTSKGRVHIGQFVSNAWDAWDAWSLYIYIQILFNLVVGEDLLNDNLWHETHPSQVVRKKNPTQVASFAAMHLTSHGMIHFWMLAWDFLWVGRKFQGPPQSTSFPSFSEAHQLLTWTTSPSTCHVAGVDCGPRIMNNVWIASTNSEVFGKPVEAAGHN